MRSSHIDRLERLLDRPGASTKSEFKAALLHVSAEVKQRARTGSSSSIEYFVHVLRTLSRLKGSTHAATRLDCLFDACLFFYTHSENHRALRAINQISELAALIRNKDWIRRAHNLRGVMNADLGNVADAVIEYSAALAIARELQDFAGEVSVLNNLGTALNYGGLYREAMPCLIKAVTMMKIDKLRETFVSNVLSAKEQECALLTNLSQSYLYQHLYEDGFRAISECLAKSEAPTDTLRAHNLATREFTAVQLSLELGKIDKAYEFCVACESHAALVGGRASSMAQIARGLCEVYGGNPDRGLAILHEALQSCTESTAARIDCLQALAKAYDVLGRPRDALAYVNELLSRMKTERAKGILHALAGPPLVEEVGNEVDGLSALQHKEFQLRAKVAEREAVDSHIEMLERFAVAADLREEASGEHGYRVGALSSLMAAELNWSKDQCHAIELAARLHDIGKIGVPDRILLNSQALMEAERQFMSSHTVIGAELLAKSKIPQLRMAEQIARSHHEWWNGEGYPSKLKGTRIPLHARIVALADVFDALTHGRPYAEAWSVDQALVEIQSRRETQFDPDLTDRFIELIERLRTEHPDLDAYLGKASRDSPFLQARSRIRLMLATEREHERAAAIPGNQTRH